MDLLDRYLQAVKKHLPWQGQDDIIAELRVNLESQLEDKEAGLGRPLTRDEVEAWLKQIGRPMRVAARYQPQQYLIGPAVFPTYWFVLRTAFFWASFIYSIVSAVQILSAEIPSGSAVLEAVLRLPGMLMTTAVWVTLTFAAIEFAVTRYPAKFPEVAGSLSDWTPSTLPPIEKQSTSGKRARSYARATAEVVFDFLFLVWLLLLPQHPAYLLGPGAAYLHTSPFLLSPIWILFYWCTVAVNVLLLGWRCVDLDRGSWQYPPAAQRTAMKTLGLIPLVVLFGVRNHAWITLKHPALDRARYGVTLDAINQGIYRILLLICAIGVVVLLWEIGQMSLDVYRKRVAAIR